MNIIMDDTALKQAIKKRRDAFCHAVGHAVVNQMADMAHKVTGTLANSMNYKLYNNEQSNFTRSYGEGQPPEEARVNKPDDKYYVRAGSALVYAGAQEKHNGWASRSFDTFISSGGLDTLAKRTLKLG